MSEFNRLTDNPDVRIRPEILKLEARVRRNIARRKLALDQDVEERKVIVNRLVSNELAGVPGMDKWLQRNRIIKENYSQQIVMDEWSHGTMRRTDLHSKYTSPRRDAKRRISSRTTGESEDGN